MTSAPPTPAAQAGDRVGPYMLEARIAAGAMGEVYRARDEASGEAAAVKVLAPALAGAEGTRLAREASAASRVRHPGIVRVLGHGGGTDGSPAWLAMELLEGETLDERSRRDRSRAALLGAIDAALDPLAAAHAAGVVHRDLKPSNIFLARDPATGAERVVLIDFGIALSQDGADPRLTATGMVMGTPFYMSPEQARASRDVGPPGDVWSVGVMLYEVLSGRVPFTGDSITDVVVRVCTEEPAPLARVAPEIDARLAAVVHDCLRKDPAARPADAGVLRSALREVLGRASIQASIRRPRTGPDPREATHRLPARPEGGSRGGRRWALAGGLGVGALAAGIAVAALGLGIREPPGDGSAGEATGPGVEAAAARAEGSGESPPTPPATAMEDPGAVSAKGAAVPAATDGPAGSGRAAETARGAGSTETRDGADDDQRSPRGDRRRSAEGRPRGHRTSAGAVEATPTGAPRTSGAQAAGADDDPTPAGGRAVPEGTPVTERSQASPGSAPPGPGDPGGAAPGEAAPEHPPEPEGRDRPPTEARRGDEPSPSEDARDDEPDPEPAPRRPPFTTF